MSTELSLPEKRPAGIRWWPAILIVLAATVRIVWFRSKNIPFQAKNLQTLGTVLVAFALLFLWWLTFSRTRWRLRLGVAGIALTLLGLTAATFRIRGVSGDLLPILESRWARKIAVPAAASAPTVSTNFATASVRPDFPQFLGPNRTAILDGPALDPDWAAHPPQILWRQPIGPAWSGFVIVGRRALTQEQNGEKERVTCYDLHTGKLLWAHGDTNHYNTVIAGEGPRCTPTVVSNRVFTLGATGILNCLDLATGKSLWTHSITNDAQSRMPEWGFSGSPLVVDELVAVSAGGDDKLLLTEADITDFIGLVRKLETQTPTTLSSNIWTKIPLENRVIDNSTNSIERRKSALIKVLNDILQGASIYDEALFSGTKLPPQTQALIEHKPKGSELIRLNRFLLAEAHPSEIAKPRLNSVLAYDVQSGALVWTAGIAPVNHGSPFLATLADVRQILAFNSKRITAHEAATGRVLWEYPWGVGQPHVAVPVVTSSNRVLFSSGYGVGSELLEITASTNGTQSATRVWQSKKMKAKFANLVQRDGFVYGLDDGMFACIDLKDGSQRWKEGRYGHGQGLLVRDVFLLMAENGELVLLRPTPEAPNELHRFRVFNSKTWNPIALAGDLLLVRNDQEAACLKLPLKK